MQDKRKRPCWLEWGIIVACGVGIVLSGNASNGSDAAPAKQDSPAVTETVIRTLPDNKIVGRVESARPNGGRRTVRNGAGEILGYVDSSFTYDKAGRKVLDRPVVGWLLK